MEDREMKSLICKFCFKVFEKEKFQKYCSRKCGASSIKERNCKGCEILFKPSGDRRQYCNRKCYFRNIEAQKTFCKNCSKELSYQQGRNRCRHCSNECRIEFQNKNAATATCRICNSLFKTKGVERIACSKKCQGIWQSIKAEQKNGSRRYKTCLYCDKEFQIRKFDYDQIYCSTECSLNVKRFVPRPCGYCGEPMNKRKSIKYCSYECFHLSCRCGSVRSGKNFTKKDKRLIRERDGEFCRICGNTKNLEYDHIIAICNSNTIDEKLTRHFSNGQILCRKHHNQKSLCDMQEWYVNNRIRRDNMRREIINNSLQVSAA